MADITETGLPRAVAIAWGMQEAPQRGPNRGLSHEQITAAAIEIADAEGLTAVTMQAVARSLGFTTMSLYRYVSSKDELLRLMQDSALNIPEELDLPSDWREALRLWAKAVRDSYRAHPWVLEIPRGPISVVMPNSVRAANHGLAAMETLCLSNDEKVGAILVISQHIASAVELEVGLAEEGMVSIPEQGVALLNEVITAERFPHLAPVVESGNYIAEEGPIVEFDDGMEREYDLGVDLIISGIATLDQQRRKG
ncbi:MAG: TetR/AcrR family transcriptional regulator [Ancrocorticia sp.]|uniref:TetR/AcrR family transcriptional regulator n=1 Tax=Ancrocorticia sp. TaxID=2593684 RepID=UPI003F8E7505